MFLFLFQMQVNAASWVKVYDYTYIDKDSINYYVNDYGTKVFDKKVFWTKSDGPPKNFEKNEKILNKKISYELAKWVVNTKTNEIAVKSQAIYGEDGRTVYSNTYKDYQLQWRTILPDSKSEYWCFLIKKPKLLKKMYKMQNE